MPPVIGDFLWLEGLRLLGARRVIVVDTIKPFLAALIGWAILGEELRIPAFFGMAITVTGVVIVSLEKTRITDDEDEDSMGKKEEEQNTRDTMGLVEDQTAQDDELSKKLSIGKCEEESLDMSNQCDAPMEAPNSSNLASEGSEDSHTKVTMELLLLLAVVKDRMLMDRCVKNDGI